LSVVLIGLLAGYFQMWTEGDPVLNTPEVNITAGFGILFAVLQCVSGIAMVRQCGTRCPGQTGESIAGLLKVVNAFGVIAFGFACRSIYVTSSASPGPSAHFIAAESFIIICFIFSLICAWVTAQNVLNWDNDNDVKIKRRKGVPFGVLQTIFAIVLFGLLAALVEDLTAKDGNVSAVDLNAAGTWMVMFGLLFSVLEVFNGLTMLESVGKKLPGLNACTVDITTKVTLAVGALAFGFACRHINLTMRKGPTGSSTPLVHSIESFIIINFVLTWIIDNLTAYGVVEW